jgi:RNA polymerase-binding transcription factor DksA
MTKGERDRLVEVSSAEIDAVKRRIAVLEESAKLLCREGNPDGTSLREMIKMKSVSERELRPALARLGRLERVLRKIDDTDFGLCYICELPIPIARLMEMPGISRCAKCEDK